MGDGIFARTRLILACILAGGSPACANWEAGDELPAAGEGGAGAEGVDPGRCPEAFDPDGAEPREVVRGLRVVGNGILDDEAHEVVLKGVNRSGSEYQCSKGTGFFDGAVDEEAVRAMARWNINAVRVPLNEACWLSIGGVSEVLSGENYKSAIQTYVRLLQRYGLIPILDLHWAAPGNRIPDRLWPMPNADHTEEFWTDVAETFADNDGVVFEPYNEPYPDRNSIDEAAWECWRDGCDEYISWGSEETYEAVGMQALVDAIRSTGSEHLILLGGVQFSNEISRWMEYRPDDPLENVAPAWHIYKRNECASEDCWDGAPAEIAEQFPIVVTELGQNDCQGEFVQTLIDWLDERRLGYLAWSWNAFGACQPESLGGGENAYSLVTSYHCAMPNGGFADVFYESLGSD